MTKKYLLLDSSQPDHIAISIFNGNRIIDQELFNIQGYQPISPLKLIARFLVKKNLSLKNIQGILIVEGAGRFSIMRSCMSVALTLGFVHKIKIATVKSSQPEILHKALKNLRLTLALSPQYSAEPNIIIAKKAA